jgi:hypothetical protein
MKKKSIRAIVLKWITKILKDDELEVISQLEKTKEAPKEVLRSETKIVSLKEEEAEKKITKQPRKKASTDLATSSFDPRDIMESMGVPYLALSKNRKTPIIYESSDGTTKVRISCHSEHYLASIYDWDIIQCIAGEIQELINSKSDIPSRTIIVPRHELFKALYKHDGKKTRKEIEASLKRLQTTGIETTVRNEDNRYKGGFGFIDSWGYTERKDIKEFRITLSDWLYDGICRPAALLKFHPEYFKITSGLKKILYRIARKHVGTNNDYWDFSIVELHKKSGSERDLRKFKHDLKKIISDNDIPGYFIEWIKKNDKIFIRFINGRKELKRILSETNDQPSLPFL